METKKYTIKDIARKAGVSAGTVDRVLHQRGDVSEKSRLKVQQVLDEINYQPNKFAFISRSMGIYFTDGTGCLKTIWSQRARMP